jgi:hypothetical protein
VVTWKQIGIARNAKAQKLERPLSAVSELPKNLAERSREFQFVPQRAITFCELLIRGQQLWWQLRALRRLQLGDMLLRFCLMEMRCCLAQN